MARLITYDSQGREIEVRLFTCAHPAIFAGYRSGRDFHVIEDEGMRPMLYWNGIRSHADRPMFAIKMRREMRRKLGY
jgi:hypothetical protein